MQKPEFTYSGRAGSTVSSSDGMWVASPLPPGLAFRGHPSAAHLAAVPWLQSSLCLAFDTGDGFFLSTFLVTRCRSCHHPPHSPPSLTPPPSPGTRGRSTPNLSRKPSKQRSEISMMLEEHMFSTAALHARTLLGQSTALLFLLL